MRHTTSTPYHHHSPLHSHPNSHAPTSTPLNSRNTHTPYPPRTRPILPRQRLRSSHHLSPRLTPSPHLTLAPTLTPTLTPLNSYPLSQQNLLIPTPQLSCILTHHPNHNLTPNPSSTSHSRTSQPLLPLIQQNIPPPAPSLPHSISIVLIE